MFSGVFKMKGTAGVLEDGTRIQNGIGNVETWLCEEL